MDAKEVRCSFNNLTQLPQLPINSFNHLTHLTSATSHIPIPPQLLESVLTFLILRPAGALRGFGYAEFFNDFADATGIGFDWESAGSAAEAAVAFVFAIGEVKRNDRDIFAFDVFPDIQLGPMQQRMNADVRSLLEISLELVPQLRRLVFDVPFHIFVAGTEITLFRAGRFFVASDADNDTGEVMLVEDML